MNSAAQERSEKLPGNLEIWLTSDWVAADRCASRRRSVSHLRPRIASYSLPCQARLHKRWTEHYANHQY